VGVLLVRSSEECVGVVEVVPRLHLADALVGDEARFGGVGVVAHLCCNDVVSAIQWAAYLDPSKITRTGVLEKFVEETFWSPTPRTGALTSRKRPETGNREESRTPTIGILIFFHFYICCFFRWDI
jgi:hypothetical protein